MSFGNHNVDCAFVVTDGRDFCSCGALSIKQKEFNSLQLKAFELNDILQDFTGRPFWSWFCCPCSELDGKLPIEMFVKSPDRVIQAAKNFYSES